MITENISVCEGKIAWGQIVSSEPKKKDVLLALEETGRGKKQGHIAMLLQGEGIGSLGQLG